MVDVWMMYECYCIAENFRTEIFSDKAEFRPFLSNGFYFRTVLHAKCTCSQCIVYITSQEQTLVRN